MGKYGQAILTIAGTIVGAYFGYPALGAALGSLAGSLLFPTQLPTVQGPRLSDLSQTASHVGAPIPKGWGTFAVPGCVMWQSDLREVITSEEVGGKGGPSQEVETATYFQDFAIGLHDAEHRRPQGVRTIWANGKAIYDRRPQRPGEDSNDFQQRMAISQQLDSQMVFYDGSETQEPDPTIEAALGVGNISAFRGLCYIVFINWENKVEDGQRMPSTWKFELYMDGAADQNETTDYSNEVLYPWDLRAGQIDVRNEQNLHQYQGDGPLRDSLTLALGDAIAKGRAGYEAGDPVDLNTEMIGWSVGSGVNDPIMPWWIQQENLGFNDQRYLYLWFNPYFPFPRNITKLEGTSLICAFLELSPEMRWWTGEIDLSVSGSGHGMWYVLPGSFPPGPNAAIPYKFTDRGPNACGEGYGHWTITDYAIQVQRVPRAPIDPCQSLAAQPIAGADDFCIVNGQVIPGGAWTLDPSGPYHVMQIYQIAGASLSAVVDKYPLSPARPIGHAEDTEAFWRAAYAEHVARGNMPTGLVYGVDYPVSQAHAYYRTQQLRTIETERISLADIVGDICLEAGYVEAQVDVTDLEETMVIGYVRTRVMTGRAALDPLRQGFFFDGFEDDTQVKFVRRGKPAVLTFTDDIGGSGESDLGAYILGESRPSRLTTEKIHDRDLPRTVRVHYISQSRDYEAGEQPSPVRHDTEASNDQDIELAIVLEDDEAANIASVLWADAWAGRWSHATSIDGRWQRLQPTDCINVPVDGQVQRMRITAITDQLPNVRKLELQRDDDGSYVAYSNPTTPPARPIFTPQVTSPIELLLLDLPLLRDEDNDAGFYAATRAYVNGGHRGAAIFRSTDGGGNYIRIARVTNEATIGNVLQALPTASTNIWDEGNTLTIELQSGEFENRTEAAVLEGANALAIGADGRWEIIQFREAELIIETTSTNTSIWELSGLLRGRRGTEHNIGTSQAGDRAVLISGAGIVRVPMDTTGIHREYLYRGVGAGTSIDAADVIEFTGEGVALKPFSPVRVRGERNAVTGTWSIDWVRRGRIGETMQSGAEIPVSEENEDYEVEILDGDGDVVRTISVSDTEATYTGDQQVLDFGTHQTTITINVYQISAAVGRGYETEATL